jgi:hypothetical protein
MKDHEKMYFDALSELERSAIRFADAVLRAAGAAQLADPRGEKKEHPKALEAFKTCRENLLLAFAKAPGVAQLFFPEGK